MTRPKTIRDLARLLRNAPVRSPNWTEIVTLANLQLVTQRLAAKPHSASLPDDVRTFVDDVSARNQERNRRLLVQLDEVAEGLNAIGVIPLVIKGGARLAEEGPGTPRIVSDLDIVVPPHRVSDSLASLEQLGFKVVDRTANAAAHAAACLERPCDVGQIDLHRRPPGPPGFVHSALLRSAGRLIDLGRGQVRVPEPHAKVFFQVLHDQLHDKAYWRGGLDLRHSWDIADETRSGRIDWSALYEMAETKHLANAISAQLITCQRLTGTPVPVKIRGLANLHAVLHYYQSLYPKMLYPLMSIILLTELPLLLTHRREEMRRRAAMGLPARRSNLLGSFANLRKLQAKLTGPI